ncbi:peptidylprolyl isomerase [Aureimonas sp. AU12]|uniref:peptidylprolyl isomerase n=1 Tax=Aureimonas sp. AU12 TaxID=1638161 RepID=UPI0007848F43|nr:peptidylprolyl isomerase [Aureimonas sp. AU12]
MKLFAILGLSAMMASAAVPAAFAQTASPANTMVITTDKGEIDVALRPDLAPKHVEQIEALAKEGFYNGVVFHRVIDGFMAQTGDPTGTGTGGSERPDLKAEFSKEPFKRGTVGMARSSSPDSANSQFFIMLADGDFLNGQYTVVGQVTKGMDVVDKIKKGSESDNGQVENPDKMVAVKMASDAK